MNTKTIVIPHIIDQHAEEAAFLWLLRDAAVRAPHYSLKDLADLDNRVEAHVDGLRIAGDAGWATCESALEIGEPGEVFAASVLAFERGDGKRIDAVVNVGLAEPENFRALVSALGWIDYRHIEGYLTNLLSANASSYRRIGIAACAIHRQDPGAVLQRLLEDEDPLVRVRAARAAGELSRRDLLPVLRGQIQSADEDCRFWATWSSVLLGDQSALRPLMAFVNFASPYRTRALDLTLRVLDLPSAQNWLQGLWQDPNNQRCILRGTGIIGDPYYIPALIKRMPEPEVARVCGEAFSMITGVDLAYQDLEAEWPEGFEAGPSENPEDEDVALDPDEDLPWPEPTLIQQWWDGNKGRFQNGTRYLLGQPVTVENCSKVLQSGFQRQRAVAALELALRQPGRPLFPTSAPGFRQQRLLRQGG